MYVNQVVDQPILLPALSHAGDQQSRHLPKKKFGYNANFERSINSNENIIVI